MLRFFRGLSIGFVATAVINTLFGAPAIFDYLVVIGKFMIVMAMAAIGLNTNLKKLLANGVRPVFLGVCCWVAVQAYRC